MSSDLVRPDYEKAIFSVVPTTIQESLKIDLKEPYNRWVFKETKLKRLFDEADINIILIIDSLCLGVLNGFLKSKWEETGKLTLSSIVPTATANAVGAIYIGLPPEESGLIAMRFYVDEIGNYIDALLGKVSGVGTKDALANVGIKLNHFLWNRSILEKMSSRDDIIYVDLLPSNIRGGLQRFYETGVLTLHYSTELDGFFEIRNVTRKMLQRNFRGIVFMYTGALDAISHKYDYRSNEWMEQLETLNIAIEKLYRNIALISKETGREINLIIVSDHGHITLDKDIEISEDDWKRVASELGIEAYMPSGRFGFIYLEKNVDPENIDLEKLNQLFRNEAYLMRIEEGIKNGFWPALNDEVREKFYERAGDFIVIPKRGIDFYLKKEKEEPIIDDVGNEYRRNRASHGGLTQEEMITPFIISHFP